MLACASPEATTSTLQHHDSRSGDQGEETRIAAFSLHIPPQDDPGSVELAQVGEWALDGRLEGIALQALSDGQCIGYAQLGSCADVIAHRAAFLIPRRFIMSSSQAEVGTARRSATSGDRRGKLWVQSQPCSTELAEDSIQRAPLLREPCASGEGRAGFANPLDEYTRSWITALERIPWTAPICLSNEVTGSSVV